MASQLSQQAIAVINFRSRKKFLASLLDLPSAHKNLNFQRFFSVFDDCLLLQAVSRSAIMAFVGLLKVFERPIQ